MNAYKLKSDYENFYSFIIENTGLFNKMPSFSAKFKAKPRLKDWVEPHGSFFQSENYRAKGVNIPDITTWLLGNLVLNENAYSLLHTHLLKLGEFLPVDSEGIKYYIFNALNIIVDEAIDQENTKSIIESGINMGLESLQFIPEKTRDQLVFKTNADKLAALYCTEKFNQLVTTNKLKGLSFETNLVSS
ncbi:MAG: DUF1629 domain-containing protein [Pseudomonadota bacterium]